MSEAITQEDKKPIKTRIQKDPEREEEKIMRQIRRTGGKNQAVQHREKKATYHSETIRRNREKTRLIFGERHVNAN